MENEGKPLSAEFIYEQVWGEDVNDDPNTVRATVSRLRKKITGSGGAVNSVYGGSYLFEWER